MAAKTDASEQVKFLVSCIAHTNNGRPDFTAVADELGIVSKAAAQKRYERMLKAHGVTKKPGSASDGATEAPKSTPRKKRAAAADDDDTEAKPTPKKRGGKAVKKESASDEEEPKPASAAKPRASKAKAKPVKKEEPEAEENKEDKNDQENMDDQDDKEKKEEKEADADGQPNGKNNPRDSPLSDAPPSGSSSAGDF